MVVVRLSQQQHAARSNWLGLGSQVLPGNQQRGRFRLPRGV